MVAQKIIPFFFIQNVFLSHPLALYIGSCAKLCKDVSCNHGNEHAVVDVATTRIEQVGYGGVSDAAHKDEVGGSQGLLGD